MNTLRETLAKTLKNHGIYNAQDVRPGVITDFGKILIIVWVVINLPVLYDSWLFGLWIGSILIALEVDQVVYTIKTLKNKKLVMFQDVLKTIKTRNFNERLNFLTVLVYMIIRFSGQIYLPHNPSDILNKMFGISYLLDFFYVFIIINPLFLLMGIKTTAFFEYNVLLARRKYSRTIRTIRIAISSNFRYSIPAIVFISILGIVSAEIWGFFNLLSWNQLLLAMAVFLIPIILSSQKRISSRIEKFVAVEIDRFDPGSLEQFRNNLRVTAGADYFSIPEIEFEQYQKNAQWKWKENVLYRISRNLTDDLKMTMIGVYQVTLIIFVPALFVFTLASALILFSNEFLANFINFKSLTSVLAYSHTQTLWGWLESVRNNYLLIPQDILFKYAAASTFFLVGQFVIVYPENEAIWDEAGINPTSVSDWLSLMYAQEISGEDGYLYINIPHEFAPRYSSSSWLTLFAIPDDIEEKMAMSIAKNLAEKDLSIFTDSSVASLILVKNAALTQTKLFKELNAFYGFRNISTRISVSADTKTLVYLGEKYGERSGMRYFNTFDEATTWYAKVVVPPRFQ